MDPKLLETYRKTVDRLANRLSMIKLRLNVMTSEIYPYYDVRQHVEAYDPLANAIRYHVHLENDGELKYSDHPRSVLAECCHCYEQFDTFAINGCVNEGEPRLIALDYGFKSLDDMLKMGGGRVMPEGTLITKTDGNAPWEQMKHFLKDGKTVLLSDPAHQKDSILLRMDADGNFYQSMAHPLADFFPRPEKPEPPHGFVHALRSMVGLGDRDRRAYQEKLAAYETWEQNFKAAAGLDENYDENDLKTYADFIEEQVKTASRKVDLPVTEAGPCKKMLMEDVMLSRKEMNDMISQAEREREAEKIRLNLKHVDRDLTDYIGNTQDAVDAKEDVYLDIEGYDEFASIREFKQKVCEDMSLVIAGWMTRKTAQTVTVLGDGFTEKTGRLMDQLQVPDNIKNLASEILKDKDFGKFMDSYLGGRNPLDHYASLKGLVRDSNLLEAKAMEYFGMVSKRREDDVRYAKVAGLHVPEENMVQKMSRVIVANDATVQKMMHEKTPAQLRQECLDNVKAYRQRYAEKLAEIEYKEKQGGVSEYTKQDRIDALAGIEAGRVLFDKAFEVYKDRDLPLEELQNMTSDRALDAYKDDRASKPEFRNAAEKTSFTLNEITNMTENYRIVTNKLHDAIEAERNEPDVSSLVDDVFAEASRNAAQEKQQNIRL